MLGCAATDPPSGGAASGGDGAGAGAVTCTDVSWGLGGQDAITLDGYVAAVEALAAATGDLTARITASCEKVAGALGAAPDAVAATAAAAAADGWCREAGERLAAVEGGVVVSAQRAYCEFDGVEQGKCEARCAESPTCETVDVPFRCTEVAGSCPGPCAGTCDGSTDAPVTCAGTCEGSCAGSCEGSATGTACDGVCTGPCGGACSSVIGAPCSASCFGACGGELSAVVCRGPLSAPEPSCQGDGRCAAACGAAAVAAARCPDVGVGVGATGAPPAALVPTLQLELPVLLACRTRAAFLRDGALSLVEVGQGLTPSAVGLAEGPAQCLLSAAGAAAGAVELVTATAGACFRVEDALGP